jgi:hypothetical protein
MEFLAWDEVKYYQYLAYMLGQLVWSHIILSLLCSVNWDDGK